MYLVEKIKNKNIYLAISLYINYFVHGMGVIILAQNMDSLSTKWNTDSAGVAIVISSLGIGRLLVLFVSGILSDKFGRKPFVLLGMVTYIMFFIGILLSPTIAIAYFFGMLAGIANSFLDAGTYPSLMECFPKAKGTSNIMVRAFIATAQFFLPLFVAFLVSQNYWFGISFLLPAIILFINVLFILKRKFPLHSINKTEENTSSKGIFSNPELVVDLICFILYGYFAQATFFIISVWIREYGLNVVGMENMAASALMSYYAVGSLICVFVTSALMTKKIKPIQFLVIYTFISLNAITILWLFPTPFVSSIMSFVIGFSAAGGILQLGLTVMSSLFPQSKGMVTGIYFTAGSLASFTIPLITARISTSTDNGISNIILFNAFVAAIGFSLALVIYIRNKNNIITQ